MWTHRSSAWTIRIAALGTLLAGVASAPADLIVQPDNLLLPEIGYIANRTTATFAGGSITLSSLRLDNPSQRVQPPPTSSSVDSFFDIFVEVSLDGLPGSPFADPAAPAYVRYINTNEPPPVKQYVSEMHQLDIAGGTLPAEVMLRESPLLTSGGNTTVENLGDGNWRIDSFFDVFFELSLDDGNTWLPASNAVRITTELPEPAALSMLALGGLALIRRRR